MCGRIIQAAGPLRYQFVDGLGVPNTRMSNIPRRYNGAPGQELLVIRRNHRTGEPSLDLLKWGLVPHWETAPKPKVRPINAKSETIGRIRLFAEAYTKRRCLVPVDGFFEWKAMTDGRQPYLIGMRDNAPFALAGIWENWREPASGEWQRTFAIITVPANSLVATIHDRMPAIIRPADYERWLSADTDIGDLLATYPSEPMRMWPVSRRVNGPREDDAGLIEPITLADSA